MNKIVVLNRNEAKEYQSDVPWAAIQISSDEEWPDLDENNRIAVLRLSFPDLEYKRLTMESFSEEQAYQIANFVEEYKDKIYTLLIHCNAGQSRSPAVAAALSKKYFGNTSNYFTSGLYSPNKLVYLMMTKCLHLPSGTV